MNNILKVKASQVSVEAEEYIDLSGIHRISGAVKATPHGTGPTILGPAELLILSVK